MGLGFTIHTKIKDIEKFQQTVESQAVESGYNAEHDESSSTVSFCRLGDLFLNYQHEGEGNTDNVISVNGDCQTNMLGPGFHKAAIEFIDRLQQATRTRFEVEDETDYYTERDFEAMKKKHFHKWLAKLFEIIQEQKDKAARLCYSVGISINITLNQTTALSFHLWVLSVFQRSLGVSGKKESNLLPMISSSGTIRNVMHVFIEAWP